MDRAWVVENVEVDRREVASGVTHMTIIRRGAVVVAIADSKGGKVGIAHLVNRKASTVQVARQRATQRLAEMLGGVAALDVGEKK